MRTVLITGANRGIGLGLTTRFLQQGYKVIATCRNPDGARELWELEHEHKEQLQLETLDITSATSISSLANKLDLAHGLDILINNAGVLYGYDQTMETLNLEDLDRSLRVNLFGTIAMTQALWPAIKRAAQPVIANVSSRMGSIADNTSGGAYAYRISKTALNMFVKNLALEHPDVTCLALHPGWVQTEMGGKGASLSVHEAAQGLYRVISEANTSISGHFLNYKGEHIPW